MAKKSILDAVHETAKGLHKAGVMDRQTMREFDALCLPPVKDPSAEPMTHHQSFQNPRNRSGDSSV